jgi:hypothetical protein
MPTYINPVMTTGLLVAENKLSELAVSSAAQQTAMANVGVNYALPIGAILPYTGTTLPVGFLTCNGAAISRTAYDKLFGIVGTRYGSGNGTTTFNLPDITAGFTVSTSTIAYIVKYDTISGFDFEPGAP